MFNVLEKGYIWINVMEILYAGGIFFHVFVMEKYDNLAKEIMSCKCHDVLVIGFMASATNTPKFVSSCFQSKDWHGSLHAFLNACN